MVGLFYFAICCKLMIAFSPVCDSYVRPETLVRICDECNFGTYGGRCIICGSPGALYVVFLSMFICLTVP